MLDVPPTIDRVPSSLRQASLGASNPGNATWSLRASLNLTGEKSDVTEVDDASAPNVTDETNVAAAQAWLSLHAAVATDVKRPASVRFQVSRHVIGRGRSCLSVECVERARWIARAKRDLIERSAIATPWKSELTVIRLADIVIKARTCSISIIVWG